MVQSYHNNIKIWKNVNLASSTEKTFCTVKSFKIQILLKKCCYNKNKKRNNFTIYSLYSNLFETIMKCHTSSKVKMLFIAHYPSHESKHSNKILVIIFSFL